LFLQKRFDVKKISIIGTSGIPTKYGGFETLVENLTHNLNEEIFFVVFCSTRLYKTKRKRYNNSYLKYINLKANGIQSIPYDIISLFKAARISKTILILGVSGCIILPIFRLFFKNTKLIINIDGLEHKRDKWNWLAKRFLKISEVFSIKFGDEIIADNLSIQKYLFEVYSINSKYIAYGGDHVYDVSLSQKIKRIYSLPEKYAFKVARIEPENNLHKILEAFALVNINIVIVGNWKSNNYGRQLRKKYSGYSNIYLLDPIYEPTILNQIRSNCYIYIHGHSAGGTNPSLVEAMHHSLPVISYDVVYNRTTTFNKALYFKNVNNLIYLLENIENSKLLEIGSAMKNIAEDQYRWDKISLQYLELFESYP